MAIEITFEASTLTASEDDRTITGILVPYGEEGRTNLGKFSVPRGAFEIPADPAQVGVNVEHKREGAFGGGVSISDTEKGVVFAARAAETPEGDQALKDVASGKRTHWSVEAAGIVIEEGKAVAGRIFGAALVEKPAFPGATLLAALAEDEDGNVEATTTEEGAPAPDDSGKTETVETYTDEYVDEDGNTSMRKTTTTTVKDGNTTTVTTVTETVEPETDPEEKDPSIVNTLTASARRGATRPGLRPSERAQIKDRPTADPQKLQTLYAAMSDARVMGGTPDAMDTLMAAITDIKTSGSLGPAGGGGTNKGLPDNFVGPVWDGREYDRKFVNLQELGTQITARGKRGYKVKRGQKGSPLDRFDGNWDGDLASLHTANAYVEETSSELHKWALANAIAREFFDLPGGAEFIEAFFKLLAEDYAMWSDRKALAIMGDIAGTVIAPEDHLSGIPATHQYSKAMVMLIQGIRRVNRRDQATYAVVNSAAYDELVYTPRDLVPEFVSFEVNTERQPASADGGKVIVVEADDDEFVGLDGQPLVKASDPGVLVGSKRCIEFDELGSTPFTVDALEIARGGIDRAVHGYLQSHVVRSEGLVLIGTAPTP